jgi:hypothetical protein
VQLKKDLLIVQKQNKEIERKLREKWKWTGLFMQCLEWFFSQLWY